MPRNRNRNRKGQEPSQTKGIVRSNALQRAMDLVSAGLVESEDEALRVLSAEGLSLTADERREFSNFVPLERSFVLGRNRKELIRRDRALAAGEFAADPRTGRTRREQEEFIAKQFQPSSGGLEFIGPAGGATAGLGLFGKVVKGVKGAGTVSKAAKGEGLFGRVAKLFGKKATKSGLKQAARLSRTESRIPKIRGFAERRSPARATRGTARSKIPRSKLPKSGEVVRDKGRFAEQDVVDINTSVKEAEAAGGEKAASIFAKLAKGTGRAGLGTLKSAAGAATMVALFTEGSALLKGKASPTLTLLTGGSKPSNTELQVGGFQDPLVAEKTRLQGLQTVVGKELKRSDDLISQTFGLGAEAEIRGLNRNELIRKFGREAVDAGLNKFARKISVAQKVIPGISGAEVILSNKKRPLFVDEIFNPQTVDQGVEVGVLRNHAGQ